jgi:hypothetical protein
MDWTVATLLRASPSYSPSWSDLTSPGFLVLGLLSGKILRSFTSCTLTHRDVSESCPVRQFNGNSTDVVPSAVGGCMLKNSRPG